MWLIPFLLNKISLRLLMPLLCDYALDPSKYHQLSPGQGSRVLNQTSSAEQNLLTFSFVLWVSFWICSWMTIIWGSLNFFFSMTFFSLQLMCLFFCLFFKVLEWVAIPFSFLTQGSFVLQKNPLCLNHQRSP